MAAEVSEGVHEGLIGQTLANRYLIETRLGEGAMGAVYKAKHVKVGRAFAVKVLHPRLLEDKKFLQRFEREAELAGRLRHPNVIGVVDVGETPDGMRYMVMDYAEGPDLASLLSEAPMTAARVTNLTRQMLEGLFHAHEQGLIHRDFKPENIIIERDSHGVEIPRIVDFGIAILREGGESSAGPGRLTTNGLVLGTPHYMAPEQAVADPIDHRIDLFALGIMVYEMLCGKLPFDGTGVEVARANLLLDPPLIAERVPSLEVDLLIEAFARRMMAKKREQRPATAKVARDLLDLIDKDRAAAAAALGVPLEAATRAPMITADSKPVRPHTGEGTFPPPIREALETPPQAPPLSAANAVRSREHTIQTQSTEPIARRRRAPLIGAAIVGVGIIGGAAAVLFSSGSKRQANPPAIERPADKVAIVEPPPTPVDKAEPTPTPTPASASIETGSANHGPVTPETGSETKPTTADKKIAAKTTAKTTAKTGGTTTVKATQKAEVPVVPVVTQVATTAIDSPTLAAQYKLIGAQLKELQQKNGVDATADLWPRYRFVNISKAMATQQSRDDANAILTKLAGDIKARTK